VLKKYLKTALIHKNQTCFVRSGHTAQRSKSTIEMIERVQDLHAYKIPIVALKKYAQRCESANVLQ
jgi:hypothetical protein